jgi:hypothetical protein
MKHKFADYSFSGLTSSSVEIARQITSLAYIIGLVKTAQNEIGDAQKAHSVISFLFETEEQAESGPDLVSLQKYYPQGFFPQTPAMVVLKWSPIFAMLERGWEPLVLSRETRPWSCASGIWKPQAVEHSKPYEECWNPEELFWSVLSAVVGKAKARDLLVCVSACPGWSYEDYLDSPCNLDLEEAKKADRVIWQRTPRPRAS